MAVKVVLFGFSLILAIIGSNALGQVTILHSPPSLNFMGSTAAKESVLKEIFSASLGLSVQENSDWNGLVITDPFSTPEAAVEVFIDGVQSLGNAASLTSKKTFPLNTDQYEPDTFNNMEHRITQRFTNGGNKIVNINLADIGQVTGYPRVFGEVIPKAHKLSLKHLKYNVEEDSQFLNELENLKAITNQVKSGVIVPDNIIDFYYFRFYSLHALSDFHGPNSLQTKEALDLLGEALDNLSKAFVKAYEGSVLVTAVTTDVTHTRRVRAVEGNENLASDILNDSYSADYAAIFNIILWFGVVLTFTLVAIVYSLMDMDPGRDSIIYRMTSTRMKKDN